MLSNPAGVHNALKMREMFIADGYKCRLDIHLSIPYVRPVAILVVKDGYSYFAAYYFNDDGTYYRGAN